LRFGPVIANHFEFYEPRTVHESSLSPCVHAIIAAKIGAHDKAYSFYLRTARLDLDDYNNDTREGCHITSMAGTWMAVVKGFGGMRARDGHLILNPFLPPQWKSYTFRIRYRGRILKIQVKKGETQIINESDQSLTVMLNGDKVEIKAKSELVH